MARNDRDPRLPLLDRLKGLMAFRVVLVTILLGGTIAVDYQTLSSLSDPRNVALLTLIVTTYVLTIVYALLLRRLEELAGLAKFQLAADFVLTGLLVLFTNGLDSVFIFIFYLNIINTAIVAGRTPALYSAGATSLFMLAMGVMTSTGFTHPVFQVEPRPPTVLPPYFEVGVNSVAAFLIALLAGRLTERLGRTTVELEQKRLDLAKLRALTQDILASLNSGLITIDEEGSIIYFNHAASSITGLDADDAYGERLDVVFPEIATTLDDIDLPALKRRAIEGPGGPADPRFECEYTTPDGEAVFLGFSISVLRNSDGEPVGRIVVFQDLTEIKRLEAAKKRSQRLAAVGELAASIAHEIRNPLASISGSVEMLESVAELDDQDRALMNIILREVDRLDSLISEFLDYSRPSSMSFEKVDLRDLVEDVIELFDRRDREDAADVELEVPSDTESWIVEADRESIRQVLWNLLNNASDACDLTDQNATDIRVRLDRRQGEDREYFCLCVEDAGGGLPDENPERIFEPFFTTKEDGSGLGLATSHRIIDEHDGRIRVEDSDELGGARFLVWLPTTAGAGANPDDSQARATHSQEAGIR